MSITGPFANDWTITGVRGGMSVAIASQKQRRYRQTKPISNRPLPYQVERVFAGYQGNGSWTDVRNSHFMYLIGMGGLDSYRSLAINRARARLHERMHRLQAGMLINAVQYEQSRDMIASRAFQLGRAFNHLRKGRFGSFLKELKVQPLPKHSTQRRNKPARTESLWLEYWFGWVPLIGDIYTAISVLESTPPPVEVRGRASSYFNETRYIDSEWRKQTVEGVVRCHMQTRVRVSNPNLYLASQLGLINPAAVVWDAIPFSFVVDWFVPVAKFLNSWTDYVGLELTDSFTTISWKGYDSGASRYLRNGQPKYRATRAVKVDRTLGLASYQFAPKGVKGLSMWTAATSVALLLQQFRK